MNEVALRANDVGLRPTMLRFAQTDLIIRSFAHSFLVCSGIRYNNDESGSRLIDILKGRFTLCSFQHKFYNVILAPTI